MSLISVISLTRSGSTATATTATPHGFANGDRVAVSGADQPEYNITAVVSGVTATTWDYTVSGTPTTPATGTIVASQVAGEPVAVSVIVGAGAGEPAVTGGFLAGGGQGEPAVTGGFLAGGGQGEPAPVDFAVLAVNFTGNPLFGPAPLEVFFALINVGQPITTAKWDFGDPGSGSLNISTDLSPSHTYTEDGVYTVSVLIDEGLPTEHTVTKTNFVNVTAEPAADFSAVPTSGPAPLEVQFNNESNFIATSFTWDFGDGNLGSGAAPLHTYETPGTYTVTLTAFESIIGSRVKTKVDFIVVEVPAPVAAFSATPVTGFEPLTVQFTNESTGFPETFLWDFGDGTFSDEENPEHTYGISGTFTVTLTVFNSTGQSVSAPLVIDVLPVPDLVADFITGSITPDPNGLLVEFFDQSKEALAFSWDFGDLPSGALNSSFDQNPTHVFPGPGLFQVTLIVTHGPFTDSICKNVLVTTDVLRFQEIWGTARFEDGTPISADRVVTVGQELAGENCGDGATDTSRVSKTINDAGVTRFLVRGRGDVLSIPGSGFQDNEPVFIFIGGRQATTELPNPGTVPLSVPFFMTLPSDPTSSVEVELVFPIAQTTISPTPGTFDDDIEVTLTSNVIPATIFYTLDGTDPKTSTSRIEFTSPFVLTEGTTTVRFFTDDPLGSDEVTQTAIYTVRGPIVDASPNAANYSTPILVTLIGNRSGIVYFRINGSGAFEKFTTPIPIDAGSTGRQVSVIDAYLITDEGEVSPTFTFQYLIDLINPVITKFELSNGDEIAASQIITVQIDASAFATDVTGLVLSTLPDFSDASVQLFQPEVTFTLPAPDGSKTVFAKVSDQFGRFSETSVDTIELDTAIPVFTVSSGPSEPIGDLTFDFTGTKSAGSGILLSVNGGSEVLAVPVDEKTTWEHTAALVEGNNTLQFQSITAVGNRSTTEVETVEVRLIPTGVTQATTITKPDGTWRIPFVFFDEKFGDLRERQHDFRLIVESSSVVPPTVTFPTENVVLTENVITVTGTAIPGTIITLRVEPKEGVRV
jgi:PKD repeat protein